MSGGHFDYKQYQITSIAEEIETLIETNDIENLDSWGDKIGRGYSESTIEEFKTAISILELAAIYVQRIDWLISDDDGEESFHERLNEEINLLVDKHSEIS